MAIKLTAQKRNIVGKKVKNLRKKDILPAELFGAEIGNKHLSIPKKDFIKVFKEASKNTVVEINIEGEEKAIPAMITNVQIHPLSREPLSADFHMVSGNTKIETEVPIKFVGKSPAERKGFIVVKVLNEIEVKALPQNIPHEIEVDISSLETIKDHILVKNLNIPSNIELITPEDTTIVTVSKKEEEVEEEVIEEKPVPETEELKEETETKKAPAEDDKAEENESEKR